MEATTLEMAPNKSKTVQKIMGQEMVQVFDGEKGYMMQAGQRMDLPAPAIEEAKKKDYSKCFLTMQQISKQ